MIRVLRLNKSGLPTAWISREEAATLYVKQQVLWSIGEQPLRIVGGINKFGVRSEINMDPIIACMGDHRRQNFVPGLNNALLFRRDDYLCMYCGNVFKETDLTRDHIVPKVQGGKDVWKNVVAACQRCNHHKGGRTPEQAGMELLAVPFEPNVFEFMYLANRQIRGDQMEYLRSRFTGQRCWKM
ncbi:HNH endonuclease [Spartinivicinus marinus]|uniref:HNH endonuclease n=1 Tax=Spartinivicinus marinus TaxID=2994442 RepID=UPI001C5CB6ED|nr:HNH endonuclease [Spartinivicinus marinus]MCX4029372.1 HNH endonuclease [Spartinivicinus marinus]